MIWIGWRNAAGRFQTVPFKEALTLAETQSSLDVSLSKDQELPLEGYLSLKTIKTKLIKIDATYHV